MNNITDSDRYRRLLTTNTENGGVNFEIIFDEREKIFSTIIQIQFPHSLKFKLIGKKISQIVSIKKSDVISDWYESDIYKIEECRFPIKINIRTGASERGYTTILYSR